MKFLSKKVLRCENYNIRNKESVTTYDVWEFIYKVTKKS